MSSNPLGTGNDIETAAASLLDLPAEATQQQDSGQQADAGAPQGDEAEATSEQAEGGEPPAAEAEGSEAEQGAGDSENGTRDLYTVKIDGQEVQVTRDELLQGYQRTADYTRKTQQLADMRKQAETLMQGLRAEQERYQQLLPQIEAKLKETMGAEPDWDKLREQDPIEFSAQWAEWQRRKEQLQAVQAERQRMEEQQAREAEEATKQRLATEAEALLTKIPEWRDQKVADAERAEIRDYAAALGVTPEEMQQITDHRVVMALRDAARYRKLMASKDATMQKVQQAPTTLKPGAAQPRVVPDRTRQLQRLAKTGSVDDAAALILM